MENAVHSKDFQLIKDKMQDKVDYQTFHELYNGISNLVTKD